MYLDRLNDEINTRMNTGAVTAEQCLPDAENMVRISNNLYKDMKDSESI